MAEPLSANSRTALRIILSKRMVRGADLMREAGLREDETIAAVEPLLNSHLINSTEPALNPSAMYTTRFHVRPSDVPYLERKLIEGST
jgi:hypothetical protein